MAEERESTSDLIGRINRTLSKDVVLRVAVIRALARDLPKDFLAPVKIKADLDGGMSIVATRSSVP